MLRSFAMLALAALVHFSFASCAEGAGDCGKKLVADATAVSIVELPEFSGLRVYRMLRGPSTSEITIRLPELVGYNAPDVAEVWSFGESSFSFVNAGFKSLEADSRHVHDLVSQAMIENPSSNLRIEFGPRRQEQLKALNQIRWALHDQVVLNGYLEEKPYLTPIEHVILRAVNYINDNSDVFTLFKGDRRFDWDRMSGSDVEDSALMTIQASYPSRRYYLNSARATRGRLLSGGTRDILKLPLEFRLDPQQAGAFSRTLYSMFPPDQVCELTRFRKTIKNLPRPLVDRFLLGVFDAMVAKGKKWILASVDQYTRRLFTREYGFYVLMELPISRKDGVKEDLLFLPVESEAFQRMHRRLQEGSNEVRSKLE